MLVLIRDSISNALSLEHLSLHEGCPTLALRPEFKRPSGLSMSKPGSCASKSLNPHEEPGGTALGLGDVTMMIPAALLAIHLTFDIGPKPGGSRSSKPPLVTGP